MKNVYLFGVHVLMLSIGLIIYRLTGLWAALYVAGVIGGLVGSYILEVER